jgi:hypothetical protein
MGDLATQAFGRLTLFMRTNAQPPTAAVARRLGCDEDKARFEEKLGKMAKTRSHDYRTGTNMTEAHAEIWQDGKRVAGCVTRRDAAGAQYIVSTDCNLPDGDYEVRRGTITEPVTLRNGRWEPRAL